MCWTPHPALRLASNEYITEVMFVFGVVPSNFRQVETPMIDCSVVVSWVKGGSQFVNQADVGGVYDGQWIMATSRWVTKVYAPPSPCPGQVIKRIPAARTAGRLHTHSHI